MIRIGGGDGPRRVNPIEPGGRAGDKKRDEPVRAPVPAKKPEGEEAVEPRPRRLPDPGTGENIDIEV
ncbi:hypothetical protein K2P56_00375 [Patescibacteria group bacterium]|nr:hypothetical protein [Patescibacteria group bacterium]